MKELIEKLIEEKISETHLFLTSLKTNGNRIDILLDGDSGVNIRDCASLSSFLHKRLEEKGIDTGQYIFEISSSGIEKKLETLREYKKNVGRNLQVKNKQSKILKGLLAYVDKDKIVLVTTSNKLKREILTYSEIIEARVVI